MCLKHFTLHAFHPKAVNDKCGTWQVFWLTINLIAFPYLRQWHGVLDCLLAYKTAYKWYTATGIAPGFNGIPF
jgi:hypothetical protein